MGHGTGDLRIGDLAGRLGLNPRTIRYYEAIGVLPEPERTPAGHRAYGEADLERLRFVRTAQRLGFTLDEIREVLAFRDRGDRPCDFVVEVLDRRVGELAGRIAEMTALRRTLLELRAQARRLPPDDRAWCCEVIEHQPPDPGDRWGRPEP